MAIRYLIGKVPGVFYTHAGGSYALKAPSASNVVITPPELEGYSVTPPDYRLEDVAENVTGLDFLYNHHASPDGMGNMEEGEA